LRFELWDVLLERVDVDGRWEGRCTFAGPVALGGVCVEVLEELLELDDDVLLVVELEDDGLLVVELEDDGLLVVELEDDGLLVDELLADELLADELLADELLANELEDVDVLVVLVGGHDSAMFATPVVGRERSEDTDAPGGSGK
jgi:hypothetical protein